MADEPERLARATRDAAVAVLDASSEAIARARQLRDASIGAVKASQLIREHLRQHPTERPPL